MLRRAFTLIELLVVMGIIAVLAALAVPIYRHVIATSRSVACMSNLRQLGLALSGYLSDHNATMPTLLAGRDTKSEDVPVIDNVLNQYVKDARVFACPADNQGLAERTGTSYYWNSLLNNQRAGNLSMLGNDRNAAIPVLSDKAAFHPGDENHVNLLYADGHVTKDFVFYTGN